jgi:hypothetical protein
VRQIRPITPRPGHPRNSIAAVSWIDDLASPEDVRRRAALVEREAAAKRLEEASLWDEAAQQVALIPQALRLVQAPPGTGACRRWSGLECILSCEEPIEGWHLGITRQPEKGAVFVGTDLRFKFVRLKSRDIQCKHRDRRYSHRVTCFEAVGPLREATAMDATKALISGQLVKYPEGPLMVHISHLESSETHSLEEYLRKWVDGNRTVRWVGHKQFD